MAAETAVSLVVRGRVQGVFFRDSVRREAEAAGVSGWACNRSDGAVEVALEGAREAVERVVEFCRRGPEQAQVSGVSLSEKLVEGLSGFSVR